jgi:hypothetical protein
VGKRIDVVDHHPNFLAVAPQSHRVSDQQRGFGIGRIRVGCGEAIFQQCSEPVWAQMDDHLLGRSTRWTKARRMTRLRSGDI